MLRDHAKEDEGLDSRKLESRTRMENGDDGAPQFRKAGAVA